MKEYQVFSIVCAAEFAAAINDHVQAGWMLESVCTAATMGTFTTILVHTAIMSRERGVYAKVGL